MACADEKGRFILSWDIDNFIAFLFSGDGVLTSPAWKTEITDKSALWWFLSIYPFESNIRIDLNCLNESGIPGNCEVSFISSCGEIEEDYYVINCITFEWLVKKDLLESNKMHSKTSQETVTLQCKMWQKAMEIGAFRIHSTVEKVDFCWNITNLDRFPNRGLQKTITKDTVMNLNLKSSTKANNYVFMAMAQPVIEGCFSIVIYKIICGVFQLQGRTESVGWYNHLRTEWRKENIKIQNFSAIKLEFIVAYHKNGQIHTTHPTSSHIVRTQNIPADDIGIELLCEDLLHLFRESIFSDVTVRNWEKSFSSLISILAARYACEALVLADGHEDGDLMASIVDFIGKHPEVISSKTWGEWAKNNSRIAAEVTRELFMRKVMN